MSVLFVAWQDPDSHNWIPVGKLTHEQGSYRFEYTRGAEKMSPTFQPFGRMTDLRKSYLADDLFPLFANRILPKSRPEYASYLQWLGLQDRDVMEELSRTGGVRATDSLELLLCPEITKDKNYEVYFFSRGLSHLHLENQERAKELASGELLYLMRDLQNQFDPMALLMRTDDPVSLVGYTPRYYSEEMSKLIDIVGAKNLKVSVVQVNKNAPIQYRVLCKLIAPWPDGFAPCSQEEFLTLT